MADDESKQLEEAKKLPWDVRFAHKTWKFRNDAYIDLAAVCNSIADPNDPRLQTFGPLFKKAVADPNAPAQEKGLDALIAYLKAADSQVSRFAKEICDATAAKCLTGRPKTVEKAIISFLLWVELEAVEEFLDSMEKAVKHKVAKAVVPAIEALYESLSGFGIKVIPPKRILKILPDLFNHADEKVRSMAKTLAVELTRWIGKDAVKRLLFDGLREATQRDLESEFEKLEGKAVPTRTLRSEMAVEEEFEVDEPASPSGEAAEEGQAAPEVDEYELMDPVDILGPLEKTNFWDGISAKKWSERKDAISELSVLARGKRILPADFMPVTRALKKLITDVNMAVSIEAIVSVGHLATGLRKDFSSGCHSLLLVLLDKFKEKKPAVVSSLRETLRSMFICGCFSLIDILDDVRTASKNKVPSARSEALLWIAECFQASKASELLKVQKEFVPLLMESLQDTTPDVRDAAFMGLANLAKTLGMKPLERSLEKLDDVRKKKLNEMITASVTVARIHAASGHEHSPVPSSSPSVLAGSSRNAAASPPVKKPAPKSAGTSKSTSGPSKPSKQKVADVVAIEDVEPEALDPTLVYEQALGMFDGEILSNMKSGVWRERVDGLVALRDVLESWDEKFDLNVELLVRLVSLSPGWSEKNVQVLQKVIEIVTLVAQKASKFPKKCVVLCINGVVEKVGDIKTRVQSYNCLTAFSEAVGPQFVFERAYSVVNNSKNPKVLSESLAWMSQAVAEFGIEHLKHKDLIEFCKDPGLVSSTGPCRTAAIRVLGTLHAYIGPGLLDLLGELKPALMAPIEAEFEKHPFEGAPPAPIRFPKLPSRAAPGAGSIAVQEEPEQPKIDSEDISAKLTLSLLEDLNSSQWKERQTALEAVNTIVEESNSQILPSGTSELFLALKARLSDTNKNLIVMAMATITNLALAMGPAVDKASRGILADVLKCLSDPKKQMRDSVFRLLNSWVTVVPIERMVPFISAEITSPKISTDGKKELIEWFAGHLPEIIDQAEAHLLTKPLVSGFQDKSSEVRKVTEGLLAALVKNGGFDGLFKAARSELSSTELGTLGPILDKHKTAGTSSVEHAVDSSTSSPTKIVKHVRTGTSSSATARSSGSKTRLSGGQVPKGPKAGLLSSVDLAVQGQPLFNLRESIKEERSKSMPRGVKMKFEPPGPEVIQELEEDIRKFFREDVAVRLCSKDFNLHTEGLEILRKSIPDEVKNFEETVDLVLRWSVLRFCESNTSVLLKVLDFLPDLFNSLKEDDYMLTEFEANVFIPCLVEKSGHNIANVREKFRELVRVLCSICPSSRILTYIVDGVRSKNNRTRIEAVDHIGAMLDRYGVGIMGGSKVPLVSVAALTTERDTEIRKAALNTLSIAYKILGDDVWKQVGKLSDAQKGLLEDKFRWKAREMEKKKEGLPGETTPPPPVRRSRDDLIEIALPEEVLSTPPVHPALSPGYVHLVDRFEFSPEKDSDEVPEEVVVTVSPPESWAEAVEYISNDDSLEQGVEGMKFVCSELSRIVSEGDAELAEEYAKDSDYLTLTLTGLIEGTILMCFEPGESSRPCKYVLNTLLQIFQIRTLGFAVSSEHIELLIQQLLLWLLDDRCVAMGDGSGDNYLLRSLNMLMLRLLDTAPITGTIVALINALNIDRNEGEENPLFYFMSKGSRHTDLVIRCLIKVTKTMQHRLDEVEFDKLMLGIHNYLDEKDIPEIKRLVGSDDRAFRMVKTVIHEVCKLLGPEIKGHLSLVPLDQHPPPLLLGYIDLNLQTLAATSSRFPTVVRSPVAPTPAKEEVEEIGSDLSSELEESQLSIREGMRNELRAIFRKIGNKARSAAGFYELYTVVSMHPELDVFTHLQSTSAEMRRYVRDGLAEVQKTVDGGGKYPKGLKTPPHDPNFVPSPSPPPADSNPASNAGPPPGAGPSAASPAINAPDFLSKLKSFSKSEETPTAGPPIKLESDMGRLRSRVMRMQDLE